MTQIAKEVGVSVAVVSRFLRGDPDLKISSERRREILLAKERLGGVEGYRKRKLTKTILAPTNRRFSAGWIQTNYANSEMIRTLETTLRDQEGFQLHFTFFDEESKLAMIEPLIRSRKACDAVLFSSGTMNEELAQLIQTYDCPHVCLDPRAERYRVNTVWANLAEGVRQGVEHLYGLGHRQIAYLGNRNMPRYPLMVSALTALELPIDESIHCWLPQVPPTENLQQWREYAHRAFAQWLDRKLPVSAVICHSDLIAFGALDAMREKGLVPGRDLSIVGYDNIEKNSINPAEEPILTTIDNPTNLVGRRAGETLLNQILHGQRQIVHERIPTTLIIRQTTGPCSKTEFAAD